MSEFRDAELIKQFAWREKTEGLKSTGWGYQGEKAYKHIVPKDLWTQTLWQPIRDELTVYIKQQGIKEHTGTNNLLSSWILCANLYYPVRTIPHLRAVMADFLREKVHANVDSISDVELEYAEDGATSPAELLGERGGSRGSGQTSPDIAFVAKTKSNHTALILTENKYVEHSFYRCSALRKTDSAERPGNPDPSRCQKPLSQVEYIAVCQQAVWGRQYWSRLQLSEQAIKKLKCCPAAKAGYQLFRQQALANGLAQSGKYEFVVSAVAYDVNNTTLIESLKSTGLSHMREWGELFEGRATFKTWTHQEWVAFVRQSKVSDRDVVAWLDYVGGRYGY